MQLLGAGRAQLAEVVSQVGTPCYAYDRDRIRAQVEGLRRQLAPSMDLLYSPKANPAVCRLMVELGLGADVSSAGELAAVLDAGVPCHRFVASGPYKSPEMLDLLTTTPGSLLSVDSLGELRMLVKRRWPLPVLLRLRPDFPTFGCVDAGAGSRFGITVDQLPDARAALLAGDLTVVGFHVFAGSQVLQTSAVAQQLRDAYALAIRAGEALGTEPHVIDLGGGFGVPYAVNDAELDLAVIGDELRALAQRAAPAQLILELGRYLVAQAGWYLTSIVVTQVEDDRQTVVVDGGVHQRFDLCRLGLRERAVTPRVLRTGGHVGDMLATDVLGCLCLPDDVLAASVPLPELAVGDVLAFPNAGAYGLTASPVFFMSRLVPPEAMFGDAGWERLPGVGAWARTS